MGSIIKYILNPYKALGWLERNQGVTCREFRGISEPLPFRPIDAIGMNPVLGIR
jgi:hypothetical protein